MSNRTKKELIQPNRDLMDHLNALDALTRNKILQAVQDRRSQKTSANNYFKKLQNRQASLVEIQIIYEESEKMGYSKEFTKKARELVNA